MGFISAAGSLDTHSNCMRDTRQDIKLLNGNWQFGAKTTRTETEIIRLVVCHAFL